MLTGKRGSTDIVLNGQPMMLLRDRQGNLLWEEEPVPFVPERVLDRDIRHANLPPDEAATYALDRFDGGIGRRAQPDQEAGEFYYGDPIDVTGDGALISPPLVTSIDLGLGAIAVADFFDQGSDLFVLVGRYCRKKAAGDAF